MSCPRPWLTSLLAPNAFHFSFYQSPVKLLKLAATALAVDSNRSHPIKWTQSMSHFVPNSKHSWQEPTDLTRPTYWIHVISSVLSCTHPVQVKILNRCCASCCQLRHPSLFVPQLLFQLSLSLFWACFLSRRCASCTYCSPFASVQACCTRETPNVQHQSASSIQRV